MKVGASSLAIVVALGVGCSSFPSHSGDGQDKAPTTNGNNTSVETANVANGGTSDGAKNDNTDGSPNASEILGSADNAATGASADGGTQTGVTFSLVEPILSKYCTTCHNPSGNNPDLTSYEKARIVAQHIVRSAATAIPSMPKGEAQLSESDKATLRAWRDAGFVQ